MALEGALVDRARVLRKQPSGASAPLGMTQMIDDVPGQWFDALLQLPDSPQTPDASQGRRRVVRVPTLLTDAFDDDNEAVVFTAEDKIEVVSEKFGTDVWETIGDPMPLATLYDILGYSTTVRKIVEHPRARL